ncbi:MAG: NACHT domain-containing protein [Okeania sp. SIO2G4]|uniref:NB-ARC domain-containing protein n=1 Tax=unclassified Okeania TaxID=2634635 RepID=UPI0013B5E80B|nr:MULTISPECIES: NB-ARC domain-containing protein [unclassified Okeania]NEP41990.1 NACHT domain-containing protein [Okeania sp. SIO2H7]NEP73051.1 NACHT domain-containing protein [Okeania sp. SIO2G5]NEP93914.1 NACHT domain-containing protein [Okeania sp. SIO2F5]NEQ91736.1 NACHT domain-containing protein [Okeania sp. SIO2G4]
MDIQEILNLADHLIFNQTGKHLDDLQQVILRGTFQGKKYSEIAQEFQCTNGHVRDVASELWKTFSETFGEQVNKSNLRTTFDRWQFSIGSSTNIEKDFIGIKNINFCPETFSSSETINPENLTQPNINKHQTIPKPKIDLSDAPDYKKFYGRTQEIKTLKKWIIQEQKKIVVLHGMNGIGKTTLALQLIKNIQNKFDYIIWQSLRDSPPLKTIQTQLIQFIFNQNSTLETPENSHLLENLRKHRCLIILDDIQTIFSSGKLASHYTPEYENYSQFFQLIAQLSHQSCCLIISREKLREIIKGKNTSIRSLHLKGLDEQAATKILKDQDLQVDEQWQKLIDFYQGNPTWLNIIATTINDLFSGNISELFQYDPLFLDADIKELLHQQLSRLSEVEKQVISHLATTTEPATISTLLDNLQIPASDLLNIIKSLQRRSLIEKQENNFTLLPLLKQYVTSI